MATAKSIAEYRNAQHDQHDQTRTRQSSLDQSPLDQSPLDHAYALKFSVRTSHVAFFTSPSLSP